MAIKDFFTSTTPLSKTSLNDLKGDSSDSGIVEEKSKKNNRVFYPTDYKDPKDFAKYGLAEKYYEDSIERIYKTYPYDGTEKEKIEWTNNTTDLGIYIFDNEYPRYNGYITIDGTDDVTPPSGTWGAGIVSTAFSYISSSDAPFIDIKGSMNTGSLSGENKKLSSLFGQSNFYDLDTNRSDNIVADLDEGCTVEFWMNPGQQLIDYFNSGAYSPLLATCIFDSENTNNSSRFFIEYVHPLGFLVSLKNNNDAKYRIPLTTSTTLTQADLEKWNHWSVRLFRSSSASVSADLFYNGREVATFDTTASFGDDTFGGQRARINSFLDSPSGSALTQSYGNFFGDLDEFRFWKEKRTEKQIQRYYNTDVEAGANNEKGYHALSTYFKFNEGPESGSFSLNYALDYSGRTNNSLYRGDTSNLLRKTGSAPVLASAAESEFKDPIVFSTHPEVQDLIASKKKKGKAYDFANNNSLINSVPRWIVEQDNELYNLTQIIGSYFDTLYKQIEQVNKLKDVSYASGSNNVEYPFTNELLEDQGFVAPTIFSNIEKLQYLRDRNEQEKYEKTLSNIKNTIYKNIYNNLVDIFKKKGTEAAFRNLMRCYGIGDDLLKIKYYNNNQNVKFDTKYEKINKDFKSVNFDRVDQFDGYVTGTYGTSQSGSSFTAESNVIFPLKPKPSSELYSTFYYPSLTSSILAIYSDEPTTLGFSGHVVRDEIASDNAKFVLSGSNGNIVESSFFEDVYSDELWNVSLRIYPDKEPWQTTVGVGLTGSYTVEFAGYSENNELSSRKFSLTASVGPSEYDSLFASKILHWGALSGSHIQNPKTADFRGLSYRFWDHKLSDEALKHHLKDIESFGAEEPSNSVYNLDESVYNKLRANWQLQQVTTSDSSGKFSIDSIADATITGSALNFPTSSSEVVQKNYEGYEKQREADQALSSNMSFLNKEDTIDEPITNYITFEKSLFGTISDQILNFFASAIEYNNLYGQMFDRYSQEYRQANVLRSIFFKNIGNRPDAERFIEYYSWFDDSLSSMLSQLVPASSNVETDIRNIVENNILKREKIWHIPPSVNEKKNDLTNTILSFKQNNKTWSDSFHPISNDESENPEWWKTSAEKDSGPLALGDAAIDSDRQQIFETIQGQQQVQSVEAQRVDSPFYSTRNVIADGKWSDFIAAPISEFQLEDIEVDEALNPKRYYRVMDNSAGGSPDPDKGGTPDYLYPFSILSSSFVPIYFDNDDKFLGGSFNIDIVNYHKDNYGGFNDAPIQASYTRDVAGGEIFRNVKFNKFLDGNDRPEAWELVPSVGALYFLPFRYNSPTVRDFIKASKTYYRRDFGAKTVYSVKNIKMTGSSPTQIGNYEHNYDIVSTVGRKEQRNALRDNEAFNNDNGSTHIHPENALLRSYESGSTFVAKKDFELLSLSSSDSVIVSRFAAPGEKDFNNLGSHDIFSREYTNYSTMNYRNLRARREINNSSKGHFDVDNVPVRLEIVEA